MMLFCYTQAGTLGSTGRAGASFSGAGAWSRNLGQHGVYGCQLAGTSSSTRHTGASLSATRTWRRNLGQHRAYTCQLLQGRSLEQEPWAARVMQVPASLGQEPGAGTSGRTGRSSRNLGQHAGFTTQNPDHCCAFQCSGAKRVYI